ncbi:hypothetical protein N5K21_27310 [Rhizobium pusense]|uniref:Uncharacterized protein n=1 Tax=Agrobacterium pusense TaxID=648995 RepID=A0A6H0ZQR1_9HYPH|nr:hypothetical protein [Agrobacterium pusense]MDH2092431.1 hypothetical protein [Agrobacterium pusense]QIX22120.1 hypothetical protein FOB41_13665 [Agrobacterium pusense]WCK24005.1 hypothetical protein CFBP5496_0015010 [Agrobacterium pusense]
MECPFDFEKHLDFNLSAFTYDPQHFRELAESELGQSALEFLTHPYNVIRMITASDLDRVAVEPLAPFLVKEFGDEATDDRFKQFIGHAARQVLEFVRFAHDRKNLQITRPSLFSSGSGYRREGQERSTMRVSKEQREAWLARTANDDFNVWLNGQVKVDGKLDLDRLYAVAQSYGVTKRYDHLNPGQQRMNIGVVLRRIVPAGTYKQA